MSDLEKVKTMVIDSLDSNLISVKLAAVNNEVRFAILEILRDFQKRNQIEKGIFKSDPLYSREINSILLNNYNINISFVKRLYSIYNSFISIDTLYPCGINY